MLRTICAAFISVFAFVMAAQADEMLVPDGYSDHGSPGVHYVSKPMEVVMGQLVNFPKSNAESGGARLELKSYFDRGDRLVIDVKETGLLDDAMVGINRKYLFWTTDDGRTQLMGYGYRHLCREGDPEEWTTKKCN